jgi:hypothetical protein
MGDAEQAVEPERVNEYEEGKDDDACRECSPFGEVCCAAGKQIAQSACPACQKMS